ncbi:unnamed protein product [Adineta ricciae]|uniref:Uncharacterized protein n=1 Tax=Adineta ricciae TaxID=249248 RepID=A0A814FJE5_ADIRI|nr:unnamed protein product [Adineta ricciae]
MSSISKLSSRSSASDFSSFSNDRFSSTLTLQTVVDAKRSDINIRTVFCGEQDCRLNELRCVTGAIIDLNVVQGTSRPFERVNWSVSHDNSEVRDFVSRRLKHWMQQTQLTCDMASEDTIFLLEQYEKQHIKTGPPATAVSFSRRFRTRSLTQSESANLRSHYDSIPNTPSDFSYRQVKPFSGLLGRTLLDLDSRGPTCKRLFTPQTSHRRREYFHHDQADENIPMTETEIQHLIESAKWAGVLSDTSDHELNNVRVCFADTVCVSKLAEILRNYHLRPTSDVNEVESVLQQSRINVINREQIRQFDGKTYWFHRILLDDHIQFPVGISQNSNEARRLAYRHMIDVCRNEDGIKMKRLSNDRVKVVKGPKVEKQTRRQPIDDLDMDATYISMNDLSCLSQYNIAH